MTCHSCERNISTKINYLPGVFNCQVSLGKLIYRANITAPYLLHICVKEGMSYKGVCVQVMGMW